MSRKSFERLRRHVASFNLNSGICVDRTVQAPEFPWSFRSEGRAQSCRRLFSAPDAARDALPCRRSLEIKESWQSQQRRRFLGEGIPAKHHHERKLLGYTQQQLYDVVSDVEQYREFVPWCQRSVVLQRKPPDLVEAELEVGFKMFVERYTSQVYLTEPSKVLSKVSDSTLFDHLDTTWEFKAGPTPSTTWLNFDIDFAFKSPLYRQLAGIFFDEVCVTTYIDEVADDLVVKRMMGAFEERCKQLYGESSLHKRRMQA